MRLVDKTGVTVAARLLKNLLNSKVQDELRDLYRSAWITHPNRRDYSGEWDVIPLRSSAAHQNAHPILQSFAIECESQWQDLPRLTASPNMLKVLNTLQCPLKSVRLMRLAPGAQIRPHRDHGLSIEYGEARLHLPLCTDALVQFIVDSQTIPMQQGELWYMNANLEHSVNNQSTSDRIHLVIDCEVNDWLLDCIQSNKR